MPKINRKYNNPYNKKRKESLMDINLYFNPNIMLYGQKLRLKRGKRYTNTIIGYKIKNVVIFHIVNLHLI